MTGRSQWLEAFIDVLSWSERADDCEGVGSEDFTSIECYCKAESATKDSEVQIMWSFEGARKVLGC